MKLKIAAIAGSLRKESLNKKVLHHIIEQADSRVEYEWIDLADIPLFNADEETDGDPGHPAEMKQKLKQADGVLIVSPEYSHGMPGVVKNALDWAGSMTNENVLDKKPAFVLGASPSGLGTALGQLQIKQTLAACGSLVLQQPEVFIGTAPKKINENGIITDERLQTTLKKAEAAFIEWINQQQS